jgi:hypothetical protein
MQVLPRGGGRASEPVVIDNHDSSSVKLVLLHIQREELN